MMKLISKKGFIIMIIELGQNKRIEIEDRIAEIFEEYVTIPLVEYVPGYIALSFHEDLEVAVGKYTEEEIKKAILFYVDAELSIMGVDINAR